MTLADEFEDLEAESARRWSGWIWVGFYSSLASGWHGLAKTQKLNASVVSQPWALASGFQQRALSPHGPWTRMSGQSSVNSLALSMADCRMKLADFAKA